MTTALTLAILVFLVLSAAIFFLVGLEPARLMKNWFAALADGGPVPKIPPVGWRVWLHPLYREAEGVARKMEEIRAGSMEAQRRMENLEFIQSFVLSSLIEGIIVVDRQRRITLVNSEFLNLFQLEQSPLGQTISEVLGDEKLDGIVRDVFETAKVQSGRVSRQSTTGRPPSFEVSAVPVRVSETESESVVVIFLPPPDRPRMVQILKQHNEKVNRLADEWALRGGVRLRSSVADSPDAIQPSLQSGSARKTEKEEIFRESL